MFKKSIVEIMVETLLDTPGIRRREVLASVRAYRPDTHINSLSQAFSRRQAPQGFFYRSSGARWHVDTEKASVWLQSKRSRRQKPAPYPIKSEVGDRPADHCYSLVEAAERAGVTVRAIVQAINSGTLTADFVEEPEAAYVISAADIDRAFAA